MPVYVQPFSGTYESDPIHSTFRFSVRHMGVSTFTATFEDVAVRLTETAGRLRVRGVARAESLSIKAPPAFRDHVVYGEDFLDAKNHPEIVFGSDDIELGDETASLAGLLTIRGIAKPFTAQGVYAPPTIDGFGLERAGFELDAWIDRRDWGLDYQMPLPNGGDSLAFEVKLRAEVELVKAGG